MNYAPELLKKEFRGIQFSYLWDMLLSAIELQGFLEEKHDKYNRPSFIPQDPISIPHSFSRKEDIEIAAFLTATIAWGQRKTIITNAERLMGLMDRAPHDFVLSAGERELVRLSAFIHRTFNGIDCQFFMRALRHIYTQHGGLEAVFIKENGVKDAIAGFRQKFFETGHETRSQKHISDPAKGSSAKRLNMFLRWMCRKDKRGVDFGIWDIPMSDLHLPLDVHTGNVARKLSLLNRKQNDWKAVEEVTRNLRKFDSEDPIKYDFALYGLGVFEKF